MATAIQVMGYEPMSVQAAKGQAYWPKWDASTQPELAQLDCMDMWKLVELPDHANIVGSKFILHYKHDAASNIASRKARLVVEGFTQAEGINYNETFSPTAKLSAICIIATIAVRNDWELEQMDIDGAYLNAPLK